MIRQVCRRPYHAPGIARGADITILAGKGDKVVVAAIIATGTSKAVGEDAAFGVFAQRLAHKGLWRLVVILSVELACAGKFMPSLETVGNGLVKQRALRMARVVESGLSGCCRRGCRSRAAARMMARIWLRVRLSFRRMHGATP